MADQPGQVAHVIDELITSVRDVRLTQLVSFVTATIVVYDYIVCMEREVELIWKKRWSVIKLAFLWHRYFGLLCVLFQAYALNSAAINDQCLTALFPACSCSFWFYWETWGYCGVLFTSEAVLLLWIYVVYNKNKWILALMGICYLAEVASVVTILTISFGNFDARAFHAIPDINYCVLSHIGTPFPLLWIPILAYDSLLLLLFLYRGCAGMSPNCNWRWAYTYDGLLDMIYRHSLLNFLAIFASYLACAIIWLTSNLGLYQPPVCFALALSITNCTRLLLNIRRAYYSGVGDPILFNIRELPPTGTNTPVTVELLLPMPTSPSAISAFTQLSETTLRELTASPTSTLRMASVTPSPSRHCNEREHDGSRYYGRHLAPTSVPPSIISAATSTETLRPSRNAYEYSRGNLRAAHSNGISPPGDARAELDWWQVELREMRASLPGPDVAYGEAV